MSAERVYALLSETIVTPPRLHLVPKYEFGHSMKRHFAMDAGYININHGSFGTVPLRVIEYAERLGRECDARPDSWLMEEVEPKMLDVRRQLAQVLNADVDECVLVPNATTGVNQVIRNFEWHAGDVLVSTSTTYDAVALTLKYAHDTWPYPGLSCLEYVFPLTHDEIVDKFRSHLRSIARQNGQKILAVIDAIVSVPGVVMPWERLVQVCREEAVWSLVDAAHVIGQVNVDLTAADPDFWVTVHCHKWLYARRGCSVLYVPKRNQHVMKTAFPTSWRYKSPSEIMPGEKNFVDQFGACGTIDHAPYLSIAEALAFRRDIGGESVINDYCHALALQAGLRMAEIMGTSVIDENGSLTANMFNVKLPLPIHAETTENDICARKREFRIRMLEEHRCAVQTYVHDRKWWLRGSVQVFNELHDFEHAAKGLMALCQEFKTADLL
ncbi:PLP-dependent transferase [Exidia glandulosa HHB12029]|uniref:PLP-dependent transferase n=1 Tax=Exidia glandulosa HHB12029 TaxID=1314781 RepID=A0A165NSA8_EXIGL|nr:PLP-dependent transferase [Exidia glandulosa HHB12029]